MRTTRTSSSPADRIRSSRPKRHRAIVTALLTVGLILTAQSAAALTGQEIIERLDDQQTFETSIMEGRMIITDRFGDRVSTFIAHSEGADRFLVEFTSRDEEGQRVLRRDDTIYLYYPDARETIELRGSALRDDLLGSDISYEDMTGGRGLLEDYDATLLDEVEADGHNTYKVELQARTTDVAYPKQVYYVDTEDFVLRKAEQFARGGRLLKVTEILETRREGEYHYPAHIRVTDKTRGSSGTEMILENVQIDVSLPSGIFSLEELTW